MEAPDLNVICIKCGDDDAIVAVELHPDHEFVCAGCNERFTIGDVEDLIAGWAPVLAWLKLSPFRRGSPKA